MDRMQGFGLALAILSMLSTNALPAGTGGTGHGGGSSSSHGSVKPNGGGTAGHNQVAGRGTRIPVTQSDLLRRRIQAPRS
jgi:hypothetical protein